MRLILYVALRVAAVALMAGALAWYAERRLDRAAEAKSFSDVGKIPAADVALVLGTAPIGRRAGRTAISSIASMRPRRSSRPARPSTSS